MSISLKWYDDQRIVIVTLRGDLQGQHLLEAYSSICLDNRYYSKYHQLWDFRQISSLRYGRQEVQALKLMMDFYCPPESVARKRRVALLAPQLPIFTAASAFLTFTGKKTAQRKVFRTFPAARTWISAVLDMGPLPQ